MTRRATRFDGSGAITLDCDSTAPWRASDSSIIALHVGNAPRIAFSN